MSYNFNQIFDRHNTNAVKLDLAVPRGKPADVLSLWVADMDFPTSPAILESLHKKIDHGIFGYSCLDEPFHQALSAWMKNEHNFTFERRELVTTPGVVFAISSAIKAFTKEGESVLIQTPVYYPFKNMIEANNRRTITSSLYEKDGKWQIDFEDFESKIIENNVKLFILCSPHNPVSRVWTRSELEQLAEICLRHNVIVFADEIHNDFVYAPNVHTVFSTLSPEIAENSIISMSPSKTFNLAGLQFSTNFIKNPSLRSKFKAERDKTGYDEPSLMGIVAARAAYEGGKPWLEELKKHLISNINFVRSYLKDKLPLVRFIEPEGTFLLWLDFSAYGIPDGELDDLIVNKAKVWLDRGTMFGAEGDCYQRINIATSQVLLQEAIDRIAGALRGRQPL
ncbi:MAG: pyridoxal phosphate-dependent aminotransferase [Spirochaetales bacterium]|nr:pyridoxal phosphate-dependent aminotransferase [Spirochaetales bacterium]